jgi:hypothetical protein
MNPVILQIKKKMASIFRKILEKGGQIGFITAGQLLVIL